jgi:hypothetical protein
VHAIELGVLAIAVIFEPIRVNRRGRIVVGMRDNRLLQGVFFYIAGHFRSVKKRRRFPLTGFRALL